MPTIRDIERAFRDEPPEKADERRKRLADVLRPPDMARSLAWQAEKESAAVATRNAVLTLVEETRSHGRWMLALTAANVVLTLVAVFVARY